MDKPHKKGRLSKDDLQEAMKLESEQLQATYLWIEKHMPPKFFDELEQSHLMLIAHNLMGFHLQDYFSQIYLRDCAFVLCLDSPDVDLRILKHYNLYGIKNYQTYVSNEPPPFPGVSHKLRIAAIYFTRLDEDEHRKKNPALDDTKLTSILDELQKRNVQITYDALKELTLKMSRRFILSLSLERLSAAIEMAHRAETRDYCQYEVRHNEDWQETETPSIQIVLAWRNTPKHRFLFRLAKTIFRHNLRIQKLNATYLHPYSNNSMLVMAIGLNGISGKAAWEEADMQDFLQELVMLKYFDFADTIETVFVDSNLLRGNIGNLLRTMISFIHQVLVHLDPNLYSYSNIEEAFCRHPEMTVQLCDAFEMKFHPKTHNLTNYKNLRDKILNSVRDLDTGQEVNDTRRKNIFKQVINFIDYTLKTNFYRNNKSALSFRLDPKYLDFAPYQRSETFPELPFGIFFVQGMHFIGFHIRFKDLSRGGLRTVLPQKFEQMVIERNNVFLECYNLAYTQHKKNKDIPEGGSKAIIFLEPFEILHSDIDIYRKELKWVGRDETEIEEKAKIFRTEQKLEYLYQTQRAFIHSLVTIVNCNLEGILKGKDLIDYWNKPEYLYLGPDENMHNIMIEWIADYSKRCEYLPGSAFISSKPSAGINHKEYGVTSFGVNVYMIEVLKYLGINPKEDPFTVKISGGPDGDVAGNQILNLYRFFPKTAKLLAIVDVSGTIYDPEGLDLEEMVRLFHEVKPIRDYPPEKLHDGGFLLDTFTKRTPKAYSQQTLCYRKTGNTLSEDWLSGNEMNHILRHNVHQTKSDIFIPAGGRPRTLNLSNYKDFLDELGKPTSKAIVEGANLYLTPGARRALEELGVLIIKDSSANKGGVICSSLEILSGLVLTEEQFLGEKNSLMDQFLGIIQEKAKDEATLLLSTHQQTDTYLTDISDMISEKINQYTYEILDHLESIPLSNNPDDHLIRAFLNYCPEILATKYQKELLEKLPVSHRAAIIACYIASKMVYKKGLDWSPSIVEILPLIAQDPVIASPSLKKRHIEPL